MAGALITEEISKKPKPIERFPPPRERFHSLPSPPEVVEAVAEERPPASGPGEAAAVGATDFSSSFSFCLLFKAQEISATTDSTTRVAQADSAATNTNDGAAEALSGDVLGAVVGPIWGSERGRGFWIKIT